MDGSTKTTRPVVLSLAELTKYPTRRDRYAITLPFDPKGKIAAKAIKQTRKRWSWFSKARDLDVKLGTRLGTLGYLPWEVRQLIYRIVVEAPFDDCDPQDRSECLERLPYLSLSDWDEQGPNMPQKELLERYYSGDFPDVFTWGSYDYNWNSKVDVKRPMYLRMVSPSLKTELEQYFLSQYTFSFRCPQGLYQFCCQLSKFNRQQIRSISIGLLDYCACCTAKKKTFWRRLLWDSEPQLRSVSFDLNSDGLPLPRMGEHGLIRDQEEIKNVKAAAMLLEILAKQLARAAPECKIEVVGTESFLQKDHDLINAAISDVER